MTIRPALPPGRGAARHELSPACPSAAAGRFRSAQRVVGTLVIAVLAFAASLVVSLVAADAAPAFPALTGRVVDVAGIIDPGTEAAITERLAAFEKAGSDQIVVATVPSLEGVPLEDYANGLFRAWKLGQAGENNGVLLLVAVDDRKVRIEVGYGLEGVLTDLISRLIIEETIVPAFRAGDYAGGIDRAVNDIITTLKGDGAELEARAKRHAAETKPGDTLVGILVALFVLFFFGMFAFAALAPVFGQKIGPGRYRWLGVVVTQGAGGGTRRRGGFSGGGWSGGSGGGFSGGGGSSGGGGASGGW